MDIKIVLVTFALFVPCCLGKDIFIWGENQTYNALCPNRTTNEVVSMPGCDPTRYLRCFKGNAYCISECPNPLLFSDKTAYCDNREYVTLTPECAEKFKPRTNPKTCAEGANKQALSDTCLQYIECNVHGKGIQRSCPEQSIFVQEADNCLYLTEPYVNEIPEERLSECQALHPATTKAPVTAARAPATNGK